MADFSRHPCFNAEARLRFGRLHLPVAPFCNVQCNFCDRRFACINESRPGVTATIMSPVEAFEHVKQVASQRNDLAVVGIAGPGDPFANTGNTLETLQLVRKEFPEMLLCVATNGLGLPENVRDLADIGVSHVTVTVNAVDIAIIQKIYSWVRFDGRARKGLEAAEILHARQEQGIRLLARAGIIVKVNTIIIPGINDQHIDEVSRTVSVWGADVQNCIPLLPVAGTPFGFLQQPEPSFIHAIRGRAAIHLPQMAHCTRCRADACGLLAETEAKISKQANG